MDVVILGGNGMLGTDVVNACRHAGHTTRVLDLPDFDITHPDRLADDLTPGTIVVNCAAYTRVDDAETDPDIAMAVNGLGPGKVARICQEAGCRLLHISTDYVFDGRLDRPYREDDPPNPLGVYGKSKLEGERQVAAGAGDCLIVRVQSLFGRHGRHFVSAIRRQLQSGNRELRVVCDQFSSPTYTRHLAGAILTLMPSPRTGIVHVTASGQCSWHEFAVEIVKLTHAEAGVHPVPSRDYPTPAPRPANARLDTARFQQWTGSPLPSWRQGLADYLAELEADPA